MIVSLIQVEQDGSLAYYWQVDRLAGIGEMVVSLGSEMGKFSLGDRICHLILGSWLGYFV